jgi:eukaryotic-like serine/threonine-protein kinase
VGRGDRRGAWRLVLYELCVAQAAWLFGDHHVATFSEAFRILESLAFGMFVAASMGLIYIALEPFVRRRWPQILVSSTRVIAGQWRDPLVGRDLLIGCATGIALACLLRLEVAVPEWLGYEQGGVPAFSLNGLNGPLGFMTALLQNLSGNAVNVSVSILFGLFLLRTILKNDWLALLVYALLVSLTRFGGMLQSNMRWFVGPLIAIEQIMLCLMLQRFGLFALMTTAFVVQVFGDYPMTFRVSAWYAGYGYVALGIVAVIALYGFKTSLGGRPLVVGASLGD